MAFNLFELGRRTGKPEAFFRFDRGDMSWCYTSTDRAQELGGKSYVPAAIKRSAIITGMERRKLTITVTMPRNLPVLDNWWPYPPRDRIKLTIMVRHHGDDEAIVEWIGRALTPKLGAASVQLPCEPTTTTARSAAYSRCWQRGCPLALYSTGLGMCNVDKAEHEVPAVVSGVSGLSITSSAFLLLPSGRFAGGFIEWARADGLIEQRSIMSHVGDTVVIDYGAQDMADGLAVSAYPGCRHNTDDCENYFHNAPNYGGDPYSPSSSLFSGNPIW